MSSYGKNIGKVIKERRESQGLDAKELAQELFNLDPDDSATVGSLRVRISSFETGKVDNPRASKLAPILSYLGITQDEANACRTENATWSDGIQGIDSEQYYQRLQLAIEETTARLATAHAAEKSILQREIKSLLLKASDPEAALSKARRRISLLKAQLDRLSNVLDPDELSRAKEALKDEDYSLARNILNDLRSQAVIQKQIADEALAQVEYGLGQVAEGEIRWLDAARHYEEAANLHQSSPILQKAVEFTWRAGNYDLALHYGQMRIEQSKLEGENTQEFCEALNDQAVILQTVGNYHDAEPLFLRAHVLGELTYGSEHPYFARSLNNLAELYRITGRQSEAEPYYIRSLEITKKSLGEDHPDFAIRLSTLAELYREQERFQEAEIILEQSLAICKAKLGADHPTFALRLNTLAGLFQAQEEGAKAGPLFEQAIHILTNALGAEHPDTLLVEKNYKEFLEG